MIRCFNNQKGKGTHAERNLHNHLWLCRIYARHKNSKTQQMNKKMQKN